MKKPETSKDAADKLVKNIRRQTYSSEEKIRIVLAGLRGEESISVMCRREGIAESLSYSWSREFLEAGKRRLSGDTARQAASPEVKDLRSEALALKECVADLTLENRLLKKYDRGWGARPCSPLVREQWSSGMRNPASEKLEIVRMVEGSHLPTKKTLDMLGIPRSTFYQWYDRYLEGGFDALADHSPRPGSVWNRILKAADLITAPDYVVIKAAEEFTEKTTSINEMCPYGDCMQSPTG